MDSEKCKLILCIIESGSFTLAAERLGYTISGVSRAVESVEGQAGFPLFVRGKKGVCLTAEGEELLPCIRQLAFWGDQYQELTQKLIGLDVGRIIVGTAYTSYYPWLAEQVSQFHSKHPGIQMELVEGTSSELAEKMLDHCLDFGIISKREGNFRWIPVSKDELVAVLPENHTLAKNKAVSAENLLDSPFVEILPQADTDNSRYFEKLGKKPQVAFSTTDTFAAYSMVKAGLGLALINSRGMSSLPDGLLCKPLRPAEELEVGVIVPSVDSISPAAKKFAEYALTGIRQLTGIQD